MSTPETAVAASAQAAASTAAVIENVEAAANVAVDAANQRANEAQAVAASIADAAIDTALGRQIVDLEEETASWRDDHEMEHQALDLQIRNLIMRMDALSASIAETIARLPPLAMVTVSSTPPALPAPQAPEPELTVTLPAEVMAAPNENTPSVAPAKKSPRWL